MTTQLLRLVTRRGTGVTSVQELRRARDVLRFGGMFALTILVPALLLAYLALSTLNNEELSLTAEYSTRADAMSSEIVLEMEEIQGAFRTELATRLDRGESPLDRLSELSPHVRGAYRFDRTGELAVPFKLAEIEPIPEPNSRFRDLNRIARKHELDREWAQAAGAFQLAARSAAHSVHEATARLGQARNHARAGNDRIAEELLTALYQDHANLRDDNGFRIGDLALLLRAQIRFTRTGSAEDSGLMDLVDRLLQDTWTVGALGEATVADEALHQLTGSADPDWVTSRRADLNNRVAQLDWADRVRHELELVPITPTDGNKIRFLGARMDSPSVWAIVGSDLGTYAFSFDRESILRQLRGTIERVNEREDALVATLSLDGEPFPEDAIKSDPLPDPLKILWVSVSTTEPELLRNTANRRRQTRIAIVLVSVFLVGVGVWFSARTIGQEIENARAKADFAANVSHELRSPITQIRLKGEALQLGLTSPGDDTQEHYDAIVREAERLSRLVDNVLDFAAIERGAKKYQLRRDDLLMAVWTTVEANRAAIENRGLELDLDTPDDLPPVWIDREAVGQILVNLMSNAAKYGQEGGWVGVAVEGTDDGIQVSVSDRGIGISETDLDHIFDHFYRSSDSSVRRQKGTGIGLTIVSYIVEAHGGTISVESAPGAGTTFTVTFPYEPPEGAGVAS